MDRQTCHIHIQTDIHKHIWTGTHVIYTYRQTYIKNMDRHTCRIHIKTDKHKHKWTDIRHTYQQSWQHSVKAYNYDILVIRIFVKDNILFVLKVILSFPLVSPYLTVENGSY